MAAPALVLLAPPATSARELDVLHGLRKSLQTRRPEFNVQLALFGAGKASPSLPQVVSRLTKSGVGEAVVVPLELCAAFGADEPLGSLVSRLNAEHGSIRLGLARPIGPEASLLKLVDLQLRRALSKQHAAEIDALVLSVGDCRDTRSTSLMQRRARQWSLHHKLPVVTAVTNQGASDMAEAMRSLRAQGRRHIAVGAWFLTATPDYSLQADIAGRLGALAVAEPFGDQPEICDLALERYAVSCMELIVFDDEDGTDDYLESAPARHLRVVGA